MILTALASLPGPQQYLSLSILLAESAPVSIDAAYRSSAACCIGHHMEQRQSPLGVQAGSTVHTQGRRSRHHFLPHVVSRQVERRLEQPVERLRRGGDNGHHMHLRLPSWGGQELCPVLSSGGVCTAVVLWRPSDQKRT